MKIWLKLLIGSLLGLALGFLLPQDQPGITSALAWFEGFVIRIGRYGAIPALVFSLAIAVYEMRQDGKFWGLLFRSLLVMAVSAAAVIGAGILATLLFPPSRIRISNEEQLSPVSLGIEESILELFPSNMFTALVSGGVYLLPVCVFAFFLGIGLSYDRNYTKPVIALIDSLSHIFYHIICFFSEILGVLFIVLGAYWAVRYREILQAGMFRDLILLLGVSAAVLGLVLLPLLLYVFKPRINPWAALYGSLGAGLAAFFPGTLTLPCRC
jgi:Na+/H+-dicarboxylate symporter